MESRAWHVFATYFAAVAGIFATTGVAIEVLRAVYPDVPEVTLVRTLPGLLAGSLFAAIVVLGVVAGSAEEIFFRGYMQSRLREHWRPGLAVVATSAAFAALHIDVSAVHMVLAFALGLYLGFVAEMTGSTLPCIVCHVVNNIVYTLQTALSVTVIGRDANFVAAAVSGAVFVGCVLWVKCSA